MTAHSSDDPWAYFQIQILSPGSHRLYVECGATGVDNLNGSVPSLALDYLVVQNLTIPSFAPIPPSTGLSKGTFAGVVIASGSLLGFALIMFTLIYSFIWTVRYIKKPKMTAGPIVYMAYEDGR